MTANAEVTVYFARLGDLMPVYTMNVTGDEVSAIRDLPCAVSRDTAQRYNPRWDNSVRAPAAADAERWQAATETVLRAMETAKEQEHGASRHLYGWHHSFSRRIAWKARHALRNRRLRADYDTTMERLRGDVLTAYREFRERAGDLTGCIEAERERREQQARESERRRREREPQERAARARAMASAPGEPVWAYTVRERSSTNPRYFEISLQTVSEPRLTTGVTRSELTPEQVQAALAEERSRDKYTVVLWAHETRLALEEWHESGKAAEAWRELTGALVDPWPRITEQSRSQQRFHGPSSNYWSPGGFGI